MILRFGLLRSSMGGLACGSLVAAALAAAPGQLHAQRTVEGQLVDSLRGTPVSGAEVVLRSSGARVVTGPDGRFRFTNVSTEADTVLHWGAWLDTLGLPPLRAAVVAGNTSPTVTLSTPGWELYQLMHCGSILPAESGILRGFSRSLSGEASAGVAVNTAWEETSLSIGIGMTRHIVATVDTTDSSGEFTLCGVPLETTIDMNAVGTDGLELTGPFLVPVTSRVQWQSIVTGPDARSWNMRGRVAIEGAGTTSLAGATVMLRGDSSITTRTDTTGRFSLLIPERSSALEIRAPGYQPKRLTLTPGVTDLSESTVLMELVPPELEAVTVLDAMPIYARDSAEFEYRRAKGFGSFVTDEMLKNIPVLRPATFRGFVPNIGLQRDGRIMIKRGGGWCDPQFWEDGAPQGVLIRRIEQEEVVKRAIRVEVYSANEAPPRFTDFNGCGAVVVWTR